MSESTRRKPIVLEQYIAVSKVGLFRIVRHGRRWRSLLDQGELGRHVSPESALQELRQAWPRARLPATLGDWRHILEPAPASPRGSPNASPKSSDIRHRALAPQSDALITARKSAP
jgi:hypothetical protein